MPLADQLTNSRRRLLPCHAPILGPAVGCNLHTMLALLCRDSHCTAGVREITVGLLDESTVSEQLAHTAICETRHRPGIVTQLVVALSCVELYGESKAGILHIKWARLGRFQSSAAAVGAD